jgi:50S ribosomal protein L16 3-hydroxylase
VESRYVTHDDSHWQVIRGPQKAADLKRKNSPGRCSSRGSTCSALTVMPLLHRFDFIPQARLDDLMVSYAVDGGGVGPHFDNYDVFLLQGIGQRRWQISNQEDRRLIEDAPLKILQDFRPVHDWVLEPGDMLYLPPHWAHNGIAIGECTTYSIGFRSPTTQELAQQFLIHLQDTIQLDGIYADPDLKRQAHSAEIGELMIDRVADSLSRITWTPGRRAQLSSVPTSPSPRPTSTSTRRTTPSNTMNSWTPAWARAIASTRAPCCSFPVASFSSMAKPSRCRTKTRRSSSSLPIIATRKPCRPVRRNNCPSI